MVGLGVGVSLILGPIYRKGTWPIFLGVFIFSGFNFFGLEVGGMGGVGRS